tara:strand:- start:2584 stop:3081 length:498 start_codon:yes stop_codon:yes gene_type:complete
MTLVDVQRNGSITNKTVNGRRIIVALSSIHLTVGNSPRTVKGANITEARIGVPRKYEQDSQIIYEVTRPTIIAAFIPFFDRLISPIIGSTKVRPQISGAAYIPDSIPLKFLDSGEIINAKQTANAPHASADICSASYSLWPTITIPNLSLINSKKISMSRHDVTN